MVLFWDCTQYVMFMKIFTSYYSRVNKLGCIPNTIYARVSNTEPDWFTMNHIDLSKYAPKWTLINKLRNGIISPTEFYEEYLKYLSTTFDRDIELYNIQQQVLSLGYQDICLLCWEAINKPCHRYVLAEWLDKDNCYGEI